MRKCSCENNDNEHVWTKVDLTVEHAASAASRSTARPCERDSDHCLLLKTASSLRRLGAMLVLSLVWRYLICAFGGGGFGVGAEWAPGQGKGADSALRPPRSCSSSCLPDWRAVDQPESSSLNTKPDSGKLPGAYYTQGFNSTGTCSWCLDYVLGRKVKKVRASGETFNWTLHCCHLFWYAHLNKPLVSCNQTARPK